MGLVQNIKNAVFWLFNEIVQDHMSEFLFDLDFDSKTFNKTLKCLQIVSFKMRRHFVNLNFRLIYFYFGGLRALGLPLCSASFRKSSFQMCT